MIFVAGGGFYGVIAVSKLKGRDVVIVVDVDRECRAKTYVDCIAENIDEVIRSGCRSALIVGDAARVFVDLVDRGFVPNVVVPAIPRHFAGEVVQNYLRLRGCSTKPYTGALDDVAEVFRKYGVEVKVCIDYGVIVASYMPFNLRCRPSCSKPQVCPVTRRFRAMPLHKLMRLALSMIADEVVVLESKSIADDIGGFEGLEIIEVLRYLAKSCTSKNGLVAIATACRCHGLANLFVIG